MRTSSIIEKAQSWKLSVLATGNSARLYLKNMKKNSKSSSNYTTSKKTSVKYTIWQKNTPISSSAFLKGWNVSIVN